jgi:hypothetical protein
MKRFPAWIPTLRRTLLILAVVATVVAAAWIEEDLRGEFALRRLEKECRDEGKTLDYSFYMPAPVPEAQNLFRAPAVLYFSHPAQRKALPSDLLKLMGHWQRAQVSDFSAVYGILKKAPPPTPDPRRAATLVLDSLREVQPTMDAVCAAARERPFSQAEVTPDLSYSPNFGVLRYITQALTLRATAEVELGRNEEAFRDTYTVFRLVEGCVAFPSRMHLAMANIMVTLALQPFWEGCVRRAWSEAQLAQLQQLLSRLHPLRELPRAFAADRAGYAEGFRSGEKKPRWMPSGWWKLNIVRFFQADGGADDARAFDPVLETVNVKEIDRAEADLERLERTRSPFTWLIRKQAWGYRITMFIGTLQNNFALARTVCALERYRIANGRYPGRLSDLVPGLMPSVPRDVIDGAPLRYACADGAHFTLYSVGQNEVDDHGQLPGPPESPGSTSYPWASRQGDWVWPQFAAP